MTMRRWTSFFSGSKFRRQEPETSRKETTASEGTFAAEPDVPSEAATPAMAGEDGGIEQEVVEVLRTVYDPEIPINVYDLGLVYDIDVAEDGKVLVRMTLTSPGCPVAGSLVPEIESKVREVPGVTEATVQLVWDPPWDMEKMSAAAKLQLGLD
jgi:FeS assembly SUF system protein